MRCLEGRLRYYETGWWSFQFMLSVSLIIATGIVIQQTDFMKNHELRFDRKNLIAVGTHPGLFDDPEQGLTTFATLQKVLEADSRVEMTSFSSSIPGRYRGSLYIGASGRLGSIPTIRLAMGLQ